MIVSRVLIGGAGGGSASRLPSARSRGVGAAPLIASVLVAFGGLLAGAVEVHRRVLCVVPAVAFSAGYVLRGVPYRARRHGQGLLAVMAAGRRDTGREWAPGRCRIWADGPRPRVHRRVPMAARSVGWRSRGAGDQAGRPRPRLLPEATRPPGRWHLHHAQVPHVGGRRYAARPDLLAEHEASGPPFKIRADPRVNRGCGLLRRHSLDELPQLVSVLAGHTSPVRIRPPLPEEPERYEPQARRRLPVKPGLTGLWQVRGRSEPSWEDSVRLDVRYVEGWPPAPDMATLWKTLRVGELRSGAYCSGQLTSENAGLAGGSGGLARGG